VHIDSVERGGLLRTHGHDVKKKQARIWQKFSGYIFLPIWSRRDMHTIM